MYPLPRYSRIIRSAVRNFSLLYSESVVMHDWLQDIHWKPFTSRFQICMHCGVNAQYWSDDGPVKYARSTRMHALWTNLWWFQNWWRWCTLNQLLQIRVAFVGYRDHSDGFDRVFQVDLTDDSGSVIEFMNSVAATGGADECEDIFGGLEQVIGLSWKNPNRVLIHVGDAPQHGSRHWNNTIVLVPY